MIDISKVTETDLDKLETALKFYEDIKNNLAGVKEVIDPQNLKRVLVPIIVKELERAVSKVSIESVTDKIIESTLHAGGTVLMDDKKEEPKDVKADK